MKEFEELISVWKEQKENKLSAEQVLSTINAKRNKMAGKLLLAVMLMLLSVVVMVVIWMQFDFQKWSTHIGLSMLVSLVFIYSLIMLKNTWSLKNNNQLLSPKEHIVQLKKAKLQQHIMSKYYIKIYFVILFVGLMLYYNEVIGEASLLFKIITYSLTIAWLLYAQLVLNKKTTAKNNAKLEEMISLLEKIENQL